MPPIIREWCELTRRVISESQESIHSQFVSPLITELPGISVEELEGDFFRKMRSLIAFGNEISIALSGQSSANPELPLELVPLFKALFLRARLAKARELDLQRSKTMNPLVLAALEDKLKVYDGIIREGWFQAATPEYPPSLSKVLTLERVEQLDINSRCPERKYDEKFHLLQAPTLFLPDLHFYRGKCSVRDLPIAIAFVDIDKFKDFNSEVGETHIDRHVLPVFMRSVEAHVFGHGYAYRQGGDEYLLLLPNADGQLAMAFVAGLRQRINLLRFHGTKRTITLSIGLCVVDRDCPFTDDELLQKAEQAKNFAKSEGRDRVAGYSGKLFERSELKILPWSDVA